MLYAFTNHLKVAKGYKKICLKPQLPPSFYLYCIPLVKKISVNTFFQSALVWPIIQKFWLPCVKEHSTTGLNSRTMSLSAGFPCLFVVGDPSSPLQQPLYDTGERELLHHLTAPELIEIGYLHRTSTIQHM